MKLKKFLDICFNTYSLSIIYNEFFMCDEYSIISKKAYQALIDGKSLKTLTMSEEQDPEFGVDSRYELDEEGIRFKMTHYERLIEKTKDREMKKKLYYEIEKLKDQLDLIKLPKCKEMTYQDKVDYMTVAMQVVEFSVNKAGVDLLISLYELILEKKGDTDLHSICKLKAEVLEKYEQLEKSKSTKDESKTTEEG